MSESTTRWPFRFTIRTLFFLVLCVAGLFGGYRVGYLRGYSTGEEDRLAWQQFVIVYDVSDIIGMRIKDADSGEWRPASSNERTDAVPDSNSLIQLIRSTIEVESWDEVGGPGSVEPYSEGMSLVASQTTSIHAKLESLFQELRESKKRVESSSIDKPDTNEDLNPRLFIDSRDNLEIKNDGIRR